MKSIKFIKVEKIKKICSNISKKQIIIGVAILVIVAIVSERFITQGTFLGYAVRQTSTQKNVTNDSKKSAKKSLACDLVSADDVTSIVGTKVKRIASNYEDRTKPKFLSVCSYVSDKKPARSVSIVINDEGNDKTAENSLKKTSERKTAQKVGKLGDESYFVQSSRQLIVRQKSRIFTITVSEPVEHSKVDDK